jgi:hypothetical protein
MRSRPPGLKTVCQRIAAVYGVDVSRLYERQRKLVAEGLLVTRDGRGPGSGVECSPENLAILLADFFAASTANEISAINVEARDYALRKQEGA